MTPFRSRLLNTPRAIEVAKKEAARSAMASVRRSDIFHKFSEEDYEVAARFNVTEELKQAIFERSTMDRKISFGVLDHLEPDVAAMVMAKYSRDLGFIADRLPSNNESANEHRNQLRKFYVGFSHASIGDGLDTSVFTENISMLAAEAIVNHPLYRGQWSSSRYLDFATQPMVSSSLEITVWQEKWRTFYLKAIPLTQEMIKEQFPFKVNEGVYHHKEDSEVQEKRKFAIWENTIKARAFDICRGLLPAGVTTKGATHGSANLFNPHFGQMLHHPLQEVKEIAKEVLTQFGEKYPDAANSVEKQFERYNYMSGTNEYFYSTEVGAKGLVDQSTMSEKDKVRIGKSRNKFEEIPKYINDKTRFTYTDYIDFGSYRDLHRHRKGAITMPILGIEYGFHSYYLDNLPKSLQDELGALLSDYETWYRASPMSVLEKAYTCPMSYTVPFSYTCDLNQVLYINELRSSKTVHQTLREVCHTWSKQLWTIYPQLQLHVDWATENFSLRRGTQTTNIPV